jgi:hypothetical protein
MDPERPVAPSAPVPTPKVRVEYDMPKPDYNNTMSALDSMIGSTDEELMREEEARADDAAYAEATKRRQERDAAKASSDENDGVTLSVAPGVLDAIEQAEKARKGGGAVDPELKGAKPTGETNEETKKKIQVTLDDKAVKQMLDKDSWLDNVVDGLSESAERERDDRSPEENAKLDKVLADLSDLAKKDKGERSSDEVREKFESLFEILEISDEPAVPKEDLERLKTEVFGYNTFWVTGTEELGAEIAGEGVLVKGNLRAPRQAVFEKVQAGCDRLFPGKYTVFVLEEPGGLFDDDSSSSASTSGSFDSSDPTASTRGPRVSFLIVPADKAGPNPNTSGWQYLIATGPLRAHRGQRASTRSRRGGLTASPGDDGLARRGVAGHRHHPRTRRAPTRPRGLRRPEVRGERFSNRRRHLGDDGGARGRSHDRRLSARREDRHPVPHSQRPARHVRQHHTDQVPAKDARGHLRRGRRGAHRGNGGGVYSVLCRLGAERGRGPERASSDPVRAVQRVAAVRVRLGDFPRGYGPRRPRG